MAARSALSKPDCHKGTCSVLGNRMTLPNNGKIPGLSTRGPDLASSVDIRTHKHTRRGESFWLRQQQSSRSSPEANCDDAFSFALRPKYIDGTEESVVTRGQALVE
ncbi:hypothetical protein MRX96_004903 [Rhipicephalus microplus]